MSRQAEVTAFSWGSNHCRPAVTKSVASAASLRGSRAIGRLVGLDHGLFFAFFGRASGQKKNQNLGLCASPGEVEVTADMLSTSKSCAPSREARLRRRSTGLATSSCQQGLEASLEYD